MVDLIGHIGHLEMAVRLSPSNKVQQYGMPFWMLVEMLCGTWNLLRSCIYYLKVWHNHLEGGSKIKEQPRLPKEVFMDM